VRSFPKSSPCRRDVHHAQALIEFALVLPVMLVLTLGLIELGRAFVFGISVQEGARQAARLAASANYDMNVDNSAVLGRLVAASTPALSGCAATVTPNQVCNGGSWTLSVSIVKNATSYSTFAQARTANALAGAQITTTAIGSVALLPGFEAGAFGLRLPQITVHGESSMVVL
jgi:Flp pilus assembly protein TadG